MRLAIIGYGKMGHAVEQQAVARGHEIVCVVDAGEKEKFASAEFRSAQAAIEFSVPGAAVENYRRVFEAGVPLVSGTTGWTDKLPLVEKVLATNNGTLLWSSNFSVGVYIFRQLNKWLAREMNRFPIYHPSLNEIHHVHKLDHPSGTAKTLAEELVGESETLTGWAEETGSDTILPVTHQREGEVPGTHTVTWKSPVDQITVEHKAFSRDGFALGAVMAAEWLVNSGRRGLLSIDDMMAEI